MDLNKVYYDLDGNAKTILQMVKLHPEWAANRIQKGEKYKEAWEEFMEYLKRNPKNTPSFISSRAKQIEHERGIEWIK